MVLKCTAYEGDNETPFISLAENNSYLGPVHLLEAMTSNHGYHKDPTSGHDCVIRSIMKFWRLEPKYASLLSLSLSLCIMP